MLYEGYTSPILRAKINQKKLREFDPYFKFKKYANPFWHIQHYIMVAEQMYHAGANMIRDNSELVVKDILKEFNALRPIFWRNGSKHMSIELMIESREKTRRESQFLFTENVFLSFYNEKSRREHSSMIGQTFGLPRSYIRDIDIIENSNNPEEVERARGGLVRKIEAQNFKQNKIALEPRVDIVPGLYLIEELNKGNLLKDDIKNYFSLWKPSRN